MPVREAFWALKWLAKPRLGVAVGLSALLSACASAQSVKPQTFVVPTGTILCRQIAATPSDSADFIFDFTDERGSLHRRSALAAFDSSSRPLYMIVFIRNADTTESLDIFATRFYPFISGRRVPVPSSGDVPRLPIPQRDSTNVGKSPDEELSKAELEQARQLAEWYWAHRCKGS